MKRLPNLDALRFFLACFVILFHTPQLCRNQFLPFYDALPIFHRGKEAVFMFFVLSGFLIIRLIYKEKNEDRFSIRNFYIRRILRIFPLYYLIVIFGLVFYNVILPILKIPFEITYTLSEAVLLCVFFMPNIFAESYKPGGIMEILWSIGIEEQFYLVIASVVFFLNKEWIFKFMLIFVIIYFVIFHFSSFEALRKFQFYFYFLFSGGVIAILEQKNRLNFIMTNRFFSVFIMLSTLFYFFTDIFITDIFWLNHLIIMILFSLFVFAISNNPFSFSVKNNRLNYLGEISYGIYMFHVIGLNFTVFLFLKIEFLRNLPSSLIIIIIYSLTFVTTIILAHFSYQYFEKYFLRLKHRFRR